jgi:Tol biopolymer transport system component
VLVYQTAPAESSSQLVWFDRHGKQLSVVPQRADHEGSPELSPDGTRAAIAVSTGGRGPSDIWIVDLVRGVRQPFTRTEREETRAIWSKDGSQIIFNARTGGTTGLYIKSSNGAEPEELILDKPANIAPLSWSRDGQFVLYASATSAPDVNLWVLPLSDRKPIPYMPTPFNENGARFSPDGHWVAFGTNEAGSPQIYVAPFPPTGVKHPVSVEATMAPAFGARWRADGRELFYVSRDRMLMATDIDVRGTKPKIGSAKPLFEIPGSTPLYDVAPDGSRFLFTVGATDRTSTAPAALTLVINWTAALAKH